MGGPQVLVVEDDAQVAALVKAILEDEGWATALVSPVSPQTLHAAVARLEPDCILLDGAGRGDYGQSWLDAAWLHQRARSIPVIMFSADRQATREARAGQSARSRAAAFAGIVEKPFALDDLVAVVTGAMGPRHGPAAAAAP